MNFVAAFDAADAAGNVEWAIVELDRCNTSKLTALEESLKYLNLEAVICAALDMVVRRCLTGKKRYGKKFR